MSTDHQPGRHTSLHQISVLPERLHGFPFATVVTATRVVAGTATRRDLLRSLWNHRHAFTATGYAEVCRYVDQNTNGRFRGDYGFDWMLLQQVIPQMVAAENGSADATADLVRDATSVIARFLEDPTWYWEPGEPERTVTRLLGLSEDATAPHTMASSGYTGRFVFSDHFPDLEGRCWFPIPDGPQDDDGRAEDDHLDDVRAKLRDLVVRSNPNQPLLEARQADGQDSEAYALIVALDTVPGEQGPVWVLFWEDTGQITVVQLDSAEQAVAEFRHHITVREASDNAYGMYDFVRDPSNPRTALPPRF